MLKMVKGGSPLRILQIYSSLSHGGAETWLMDIMRNTIREELLFDICLTGNVKGPYEDEFKNLGGKIYRCSLSKNLLSFSHRFKQILTAECYDIVHSHLYYFSGFVLRLAAQADVPKRIAHIHPVEDFRTGGFFRSVYKGWMKKWIVRYGTVFVGPTKMSLEGFWGPDWQEDPRKQVIYNGIRTERFAQAVDRVEVRQELDIPESAALVLNVSSFRPHKRHKFLVQVAEHVLAQRQNVYFLLIGSGTLKETIKQQVRGTGLASHFRFISGLPNIDRYWLAADVFAFPSCNEGFGIAIIEAAAAGLKVIAQDIPGVREAAFACPDAILLPLETPAEQWGQRLLDVLKKPRIPETRRHKLLKEFPFTIENSIKKLREVYYG
jgi:glycosyltransferase EpsF